MHDMWEQLNDANYNAAAHEMMDECSDAQCWGPGPPPEFRLPPPPRPPFLSELATGVKCTEEPLPDIEMCSTLPAILDPSFHISPSQTSTLIFVCSVLLVFTVCLSSFVVWKHKRKVPGFLQCKTPGRGGHPAASAGARHHSPSLGGSGSICDSRHRNMMMHHHAAMSGGSGTMSSSGAGGALYEDPDQHIIGRVPLVLRQHQLHHQQQQLLQHNEALLPKSIHYPSGYPMPHSPPIFVCSSPGPDPYRSNDNVYEELDQQQQQQQEQQQHQQLHAHDTPTRRNSDVSQSGVGVDESPSPDAEDCTEVQSLMLDHHAMFQKSAQSHHYQSQHGAPHNLYQMQPPVGVSTIYHERRSAGDLLDHRSFGERNSLLSSSTSSSSSCAHPRLQQQQQQHYHQRNHHTMQQPARNGRSPRQQVPPSYEVIQQQQQQHQQQLQNVYSYARTVDRASPRFYRHPANNPVHILNAAPYGFQSQRQHLPVGSFAAALQHDVEVKRRNQLNVQLSSQASAISTIYQTTDPLLDTQSQSRSRTQPRPPADRRRVNSQRAGHAAAAPSQPTAVVSASAAAVSNASAGLYGTYRGQASGKHQQLQHPNHYHHQPCGSQYPSYISPAEFSTFRQPMAPPVLSTTASTSRPAPPSAAPSSLTASTASDPNDGGGGGGDGGAAAAATTASTVLNPITSRDSSFGSDSGYSHHTQSSSHIAGLLADGGAAAVAGSTTAAHAL